MAKKPQPKKKVKASPAKKKSSQSDLDLDKPVAKHLSDIMDILDGAVPDAEKFDDGKKSPGSRVRKALQTVAKECKNLRKVITEKKKEM